MKPLKAIFFFCVCLLHYTSAKAQNHVLDTWPVGVPLSYIHFMDDGTYSFDTTGLWAPYRHDETPSYALDSLKNILFQSNGNVVANREGQILENGDSLPDEAFFSSHLGTGNFIPQSVLILQAKKNIYRIFYYSFSDSLWDSGTGSADRLYYAIVDMSANDGAGKVINKKIPVYKGVMGGCRLTAVKHANGRDWWLVNHGYLNDIYNKFLVTADTVVGPFEQHIGFPDSLPDLIGGAQFSLDGTKYASGTIGSPMNIMDFDRCTGLFSNPISVNVYSERPWTPSFTNSIVDALCFSPNGRFLYITTLKYLLQYDTWTTPISSSRYLIAKVDSTYKNSSPFYSLFITPHNKIIIANYQGLPAFCNYHTIESPDLPGAACNFQKESLFIPSSYSNYTLPNVVNLKLGALSGSACDTIVTTTGPQAPDGGLKNQIRVFPNLATDVVFIETSGYGPGGELEVTNALGQRCYYYPNFDETTAIKTRDWPSGPYFWRITRKGQITGQGKLLVQH